MRAVWRKRLWLVEGFSQVTPSVGLSLLADAIWRSLSRSVVSRLVCIDEDIRDKRDARVVGVRASAKHCKAHAISSHGFICPSGEMVAQVTNSIRVFA